MALNSLVLNGTTSKVAAPALSGLSTGFSFACWLRLAATSGAAQGLIANATGSSDRASLAFIGGSPGFLSGGYYNGAAFSGAKSSDAALQVGRWYHIVYTYDGATGRLYLNNAAQRGAVTPSTGATAALTIGCRNDSTLFTPGKITRVGIWKRALTKSEVRYLFEIGRFPFGAAANYRLDDGHGQVAVDLSANQVNGAITAGTWSRDVPERVRQRFIRNRRVALT